jgi:DNA-binding GntR family transcriptional regulator
MQPSSTDALYEQLKSDITHFLFRPGERLVEESLADRYGVSRTPIRETLRRLEQEGLLVSNGSLGRSVPAVDIARFEDVYRVRAAVERLAAEQACERASDEAIAKLRAAWDEPYRTDPSSPEGSYDRADERFHVGVAALSENTFLIDSLTRINDRIRIIRLVDFNDPGRIEITTREHHAILSAIEDRNAELAGELIHAHVERSMASVRSLIARALERIYLDR